MTQLQYELVIVHPPLRYYEYLVHLLGAAVNEEKVVFRIL